MIAGNFYKSVAKKVYEAFNKMYKTNIAQNNVSEKIKIDPSEIKQEFSNPQIKLLCCRYWILSDWQCSDLSVPFWRIYHNQIPGAEVRYNGITTRLEDQNIIIIPPNTSFSSSLGNFGKHGAHESIIGRKFNEGDNLASIARSDRVDHLFIHFSLGFPLDRAKRGVYTIDSTPELRQLISKIIEACINDVHFSFLECILIKHLISSCIVGLTDIWQQEVIDNRIFTAMGTIEKDFSKNISNASLASQASMATNSFSRLFKETTRLTVQQYVTKIRIEVACSLMHHTNKSIDEIAFDCGFYDRHHFSKIFKRNMGVNPSYYMKKLIIS